ncbi:MAG: hypothetical protein ACK49E_26970, partial [Planctomyces sp.]
MLVLVVVLVLLVVVLLVVVLVVLLVVLLLVVDDGLADVVELEDVVVPGIMVVLVPGGCGPDVVVPGADVVVLVLVVLDEVEVVDDVVLVDVLEVPGP